MTPLSWKEQIASGPPSHLLHLHPLMNQIATLACCQPACQAAVGCSLLQAATTERYCSVAPCACEETTAAKRCLDESWAHLDSEHCFLDGYCPKHAEGCYLSVS